MKVETCEPDCICLMCEADFVRQQKEKRNVLARSVLKMATLARKIYCCQKHEDSIRGAEFLKSETKRRK